MRHKYNRSLELHTGNQKRDTVIRTMLTNLVEHGRMTTTVKRARVLKGEADSFFAGLVRCYTMYAQEADATREIMRRLKTTLFTENAGKKIVQEFLPRWKEANKQSGFVTSLKLGARPGDSAEKILVQFA